MIINNQSSAVKVQGAVPLAENRPPTPESELTESSDTLASTCVSSLGHQLSAAAVNAQRRDATLGPQALGQKATQILDELSNHLGSVSSDSFEGMSRDQLALITYDESGEFTAQERVSAWRETAEQEQIWRQSVATRALDVNTAGKINELLNEALIHFKSLPEIEQAQYPAGYANNLLSQIDLGSSNPPVTNLQVISPMAITRGLLPEVTFARSPKPADSTAITRDLSVTKNSSSDDRGRQLMVTRLFGSYEPPVIDTSGGIKCSDLARGGYEFLTKQDRHLLSDIYAYVEDKDVDMTFVDLLASDIGSYRLFGNGRFLSGFNTGSYDLEGWQQTVSFTEADAAIASRMLSGTAISSSRFDQGFLRHILNPTFVLGKLADFGFMEHLVTKFSADADSAVSLGSQFSNHVPKEMGEGYVMTTSSTVRIKIPEPDFITENGVTFLTEKGRALGFTLDEDARVAARPYLELVRAKDGLEILRQWHGNERRPGWLGSLWDRLGEK